LSWFTPSDLLSLQEVAEGLMVETVSILRAAGDPPAYTEAGTTKARILPPGQTADPVTQLIPGTKFPAGEFYVPVGTDVRRKDRLRVSTQGDKEFDALALLNPRSLPTKLRIIGRECIQPERRLWAVTLPAISIATPVSGTKILPASVREIIPAPFIVEDPIEMASIGSDGGDGVTVVGLARLDVSEVPFDSFVPVTPPSYWIVVEAGIVVTPEDARDGKYPRYLLQGSARLSQGNWSIAPEWEFRLVQDS
jgi:hypothetical protein